MELKHILAGAGISAVIAFGLLAGATSGPRGSATAASSPPAPARLALQTQAQVAGPGAAAAAPRGQTVNPAAAPEPTEVGATPEPTEVGATPEPTTVGATPEPTTVAGQDGDNVQEGDQTGSDSGAGGADSPAADAGAAAGAARITPQQAGQTALAAHPGTRVVTADLGDENGTQVYDVQLSNGLDVKVSATSGAILGTDTPGTDSGQ